MAKKRHQNQEPPADGDPGQEQTPIENRIIGPAESGLKNFANVEEVRSQVEAMLPMVQKTRDNRTEVETRWDRYRDIYALRQNVKYYNGRSQLFLGALRQAVDSTVRVAKNALFSGDYIDAISENPRLKKISVDFLKYLLEDQAKIKVVAPLYLRQLYTIGTSCLKLGWTKRKKNVRYREVVDGELRIKTRKIFDKYGPCIDVVDMKRIFVYPETAIDYEGLKLVFEDTTTSVGKLKKKKKFYDPDALTAVVERKINDLAERRKSSSEAIREGIGELNIDEEEIDVTEAWMLVTLPDEDDEQWVMVTIAGDEILRISENPWWFQHPPYLFGAIFRTHDYFYGHGLIEGGEMWQYMLNDVANQSVDSTTFSLNAITAYDPNEIDDPDALKLQPLAKWPIKPDAVEIFRPPAQMGIEGLTMVRFLLNVIQDQSGANALIQGAPREGLGKATGTATGVSTLMSQAQGDILDQVEEQEQQVFTPMLKAVEIMAHEMMDDEMVIRHLGPDGITLTQRIVSPQDLVLSADLRWISSLRVKERTVQAQQLLNYMNIIMSVPPEQLAASGVRIKLGKVIQLVASIGLDLPEAESLVEDVTQTLPDTSPELEHSLLAAGRMVVASPVSTPEIHRIHLESHYAAMQMTTNEMYQMKLLEHIQSHFAAMQPQMQMTQQQGGGMNPQSQPQGNTGADLLRGILSQAGGSTGVVQ